MNLAVTNNFFDRVCFMPQNPLALEKEPFHAVKVRFDLKELLAAEMAKKGELDAASLMAVVSRDPLLNILLNARAGVWEKNHTLTIREHVERVLDGIKKYDITLDEEGPNAFPLSRNKFALTMVLHDLAKVLPTELEGGVFPEGTNKEAQHARTAVIFDLYKESLPFTEGELKLVKFLLGNDCLGSLFKNIVQRRIPPTFPKDLLPDHIDRHGRTLLLKTELERLHRTGELPLGKYREAIQMWEDFTVSKLISGPAVEEQISQAAGFLQAEAKELGMSPLTLLRCQVLYFQLDIHAYTRDCEGGIPSLDYVLGRNRAAQDYKDRLFNYAPRKKRFIFSAPFEPVFEMLEKRLTDMSKPPALPELVE